MLNNPLPPIIPIRKQQKGGSETDKYCDWGQSANITTLGYIFLSTPVLLFLQWFSSQVYIWTFCLSLFSHNLKPCDWSTCFMKVISLGLSLDSHWSKFVSKIPLFLLIFVFNPYYSSKFVFQIIMEPKGNFQANGFHEKWK